METLKKEVRWRCNTVALFQEMVINNDKMGIFKQPVNILGRILAEVAERCSQINDPELNSLMCRLALYEKADPYSKEYDQKLTEKTINYK